MNSLKIETDGWGKIWIADYSNGGTRIVETFTGQGWKENMKNAKARLAQLTSQN